MFGFLNHGRWGRPRPSAAPARLTSYVHTCMYTCMHTCVYICVCVYIYIYIYNCTTTTTTTNNNNDNTNDNPQAPGGQVHDVVVQVVVMQPRFVVFCLFHVDLLFFI